MKTLLIIIGLGLASVGYSQTTNDFPKAVLKFAGYASPDSALETWTWAMTTGDKTVMLQTLPEAFADSLARRAEAVFAANPFWQRKFQSPGGREAILTSMRHWLAGVLAQERPALFRDLPDSFKVGQPLPVAPRPDATQSGNSKTSARGRHFSLSLSGKTKSGRTRPTTHLVHGCELLAV